jgi:hypothetical protein
LYFLGTRKSRKPRKQSRRGGGGEKRRPEETRRRGVRHELIIPTNFKTIKINLH